MLLDTNIVSAFLKRDAQKRTPTLFGFVTSVLAAEGLFERDAEEPEEPEEPEELADG